MGQDQMSGGVSILCWLAAPRSLVLIYLRIAIVFRFHWKIKCHLSRVNFLKSFSKIYAWPVAINFPKKTKYPYTYN